MYRVLRAFVLLSVLVVPLSACSSVSDFSIDPTEWMPDDLFGTKKKLPGERRPVFPEGVPGVAHGVPPDLVKGAQPDADLMAADAADVAEQEPAPPEPEPKPKPKAKPKPKPKPRVAKSAPVEQPTRPTPVRATPVSPRPPMQQQATTGGTQWPDPPAPSGGRRPSGGVQWPDPPATQ
jgi:hypothetical protein